VTLVQRPAKENKDANTKVECGFGVTLACLLNDFTSDFNRIPIKMSRNKTRDRENMFLY